LKDKIHILGNHQILCAMEGSSIKQQDIEGVVESFGDLVDKDLKTRGIQMRECEKELFACLRFDDPIKIKRLVLLLKWGDGFDPFSCNNSPDDGHKAKTALILGENLDGELLGVCLLGFVQVFCKLFFLNASSLGVSFFT
jgi:hypothetical protein